MDDLCPDRLLCLFCRLFSRTKKLKSHNNTPCLSFKSEIKFHLLPQKAPFQDDNPKARK